LVRLGTEAVAVSPPTTPSWFTKPKRFRAPVPTPSSSTGSWAMATLAKAVARSATALVMADIDNFKAYNDRFGHLTGDALICALAEALRETARDCAAFIAHVGGDDFAVVCDPAEAREITRAAAAKFARRTDGLAAGMRPQVTVVSTTVKPEEADGLEATFRRLARLRHEARGAAGKGKREQ
ncbi:MAG: GGDEF domain-containing protein, partial [Armatimonadota bacterium]